VVAGEFLMSRNTIFVPLLHVSRALGLPRDWLIRQTAGGHLPHLQIGREIYFHYNTVVDCVIEMMRRNVTAENDLMMAPANYKSNDLMHDSGSKGRG
jgi:hypothetical protein